MPLKSNLHRHPRRLASVNRHAVRCFHNPSRTVQLSNLRNYTRLQFMEILRPYEPVNQMRFLSKERIAFVNFFDWRVAAQLIEDINSGRLRLIGGCIARSVEDRSRNFAYSLAGLWRGESRSVVLRTRGSKDFVRRMLNNPEDIMDIEGYPEGIWRDSYVVTYNRMLYAMQALTESKIPTIAPLPFGIGFVQNSVSSFQDLGYPTSANTVHISGFTPTDNHLLKLCCATNHLSVESGKIQDSNVMTLRFSMARNADIFLNRLGQLSTNFGDPFTSWVKSSKIHQGMSSSRHQWLAIKLGMSRTISLKPKPHSPTSLDSEKLRRDFSRFGIISRIRLDPDTGRGYVDFLDIDSAVAAIISLVGGDLKRDGYEAVDVMFHRYPSPKRHEINDSAGHDVDEI